MRIFYTLSGLFITIFICLVPLRRHLLEYKVQKQGQLVNVQLINVPHSVGCKIKYFMGFVYAGKEYSKKVGCNFGKIHKSGDNIHLKHLDGTDIFLLPDESITKELFAFGALALFGLGLMVYGIKSNNRKAAYNTSFPK
jgi:hypothetical protein